jgi:uncharacterized damage-inducible protein DinB
MSSLIKKQFVFIREKLLNEIEGVSEELLDIQPEGFNNTIHWQLGHIVSAAEGFLFGANATLPAEYREWFGYGSRPSNWGSEVPTVATLLEQLKSQLERIQAIPDENFEVKLPEPVIGNTTFGELASFTAFHEASHYGQIHTMIRLVETTSQK